MDYKMSQTYTTYTSISARALVFNPKFREVVAKKQEIASAIEQHYQHKPNSILYYGFNPMMLASATKSVYVTAVDQSVKNMLEVNNIKYTYIDEQELSQHKKQFDWVVAVDEYFTFADSEDQQKVLIADIVGLAKDLVVTTLRDYKNQDFKDREFSQPQSVHHNHDSKVFVEHHKYDYNDRNNWATTVYELHGNKSTVYGPFARRSMYFKQMAKFSIDAGAKEFYVHKNLMYKSLIRKNYEHVISISF
jgi:hypothetical protein